MNPATSELPREFGKDDPDLDGAVDRIALRRAMKDLPVGYRQVFMLHDVEGYEHRDIARLLRCSIGNSKSQLHKARVKMRDLLGLDKPVRTWRRNASKGRAECSRGDIYATGSGWRALCA